MNTQDGFTPDQAILIAKAAGLDASDLERQAKESAGASALQERVQALEAQLETLAEAESEQPSLAEQQLQAGRRMVDAMQRQKIGPYGWMGDQDVPAA